MVFDIFQRVQLKLTYQLIIVKKNADTEFPHFLPTKRGVGS